MSIIKINAITVPADSGDELAKRFAARASAVDGQDGFEGFELLQPTDGRTVWLVVTRWRDEEAYQGWITGPDFAAAHARMRADAAAQAAAGSDGAGSDGGAARPVGISAELWNYTVADLSS